MDNSETYLRELLYEAKEIRRLLESIRYDLKEIPRIKEEVVELKRTIERR